MNSTIDETKIYASGRTYAEHCAWLDSLSPDENLIVCTPVGYRYALILVSITKRLLAHEMPAEQRLRFLEFLEKQADSWTADTIANIRPMCDDGFEMVREAQKLGAKKSLDVYAEHEVFSAFVLRFWPSSAIEAARKRPNKL